MKVELPEPIVQIALNGETNVGFHTYIALGQSGKVYIWGWYPYDIEGVSYFTSNSTKYLTNPHQITEVTNVTDINSDGYFAQDRDNNKWILDPNVEGLSINENLEKYTKVYENSALDDNGDVWVWGGLINFARASGTSNTIRNQHIRLPNISNVVDIYEWANRLFIITEDGSLYRYGHNWNSYSTEVDFDNYHKVIGF